MCPAPKFRTVSGVKYNYLISLKTKLMGIIEAWALRDKGYYIRIFQYAEGYCLFGKLKGD